MLVSTTVIEVGVDVPNATVMVILDADRFGVSQLHQLRGRIGRGGHAGLCLLVSAADPASTSMERLLAVAGTRDGFELSRIDLEQRREGNVLGIEQSGGALAASSCSRCSATRTSSSAPGPPRRAPRERPRPRPQPGTRGGNPSARGVRAGRLPGEDVTHWEDGMTRIIGGTAGGRRLRTPSGDATRPTADRVREALFSALEAELGSLTGLRFLDLYAGSGAVGLEAMSRGAAAVTSVESDRRTARLVQDNASTLGFDEVEVLAQPVARVLGGTPGAPYDVVFADPPYPLDERGARGGARPCWSTHGWLAPGGCSSWSGRRVAWNPPGPRGWCASGTKEYGETVLWYVRAGSEDDR